MVSNILVTGPPGIGKTTFIEKVLKRVKPSAGGFYTQEIREGKRRVGFRIITLDGKEGMLAHVGISSSSVVGKYRVNIDGLRDVGISAAEEAIKEDGVVVIDEIGKMELCHPQFKEVVERSLNSDKVLLATIGRISNPYIEGIKRRSDVCLIELTLANRERSVDEVAEMINDKFLTNSKEASS